MNKVVTLDNYDVVYGDSSSALITYLSDKSYTSINVIVDENTRAHCLPHITDSLPKDCKIIDIPSGEKHKGLSTCEIIWDQMVRYQLDRHALIINLGGGVIGDMGGFAASCYMRGVDFIQIPTTLLSQVDASIGGKLAVDFRGLKNFIGLFKNPNQVIVDPKFLSTLSDEEFRSGYAEMIKHALIRDHSIWSRMLSTAQWKDLDWNEEILASILIKKDVVEQDPKEKGLRKILNFGHTIGHAVESLSFETDKPLLHGEAIAIGMICEAFLSANLCALPNEELDKITSYILSVYDDLDLTLLTDQQEIFKKLKQDKKNKGGRILFSLLEAPGKCAFDIEANEKHIFASLDYLISSGK